MNSNFSLSDRALWRDHCYIYGHWVQADDGATFPVLNPATRSPIGQVPDLGKAETARAIDAAEQAFRSWRTHTAKQRGVILRAWHDLILAAQEDLAAIITLEQGKPLAESRAEVRYGASFLEWFAEEGRRAYGETIPTQDSSRRLLTIRQPVGVVGAITPWNFPFAMAAKKLGPALASGCTVVLKPAEDTPFTLLAIAELGHRAGVPAGVLNVVTGAPEVIGAEITSNPKVRKVSFTGSTEVGRLIMRQCADTIKNLSLELGGNAPFIVFDDADLDLAVAGAVASKYRNAGQTCVCANRFLVQDGIYREFTERLMRVAGDLRVGDGFMEGVQIGPLIHEEALCKVENLIADAVSHGARVLVGGQRRDSVYFPPTVIDRVTPEMAITREEIFGPVATLLRFATEAEALELANATRHGLAAYFYGRDIGRIWRVAEGLEYGMVGINEGLISTEIAPFGGVKESGLGREGGSGGIEEYLETKYLCMGGIQS